MVLLDTETPGTSREIYNEDADGETRTIYYLLFIIYVSYTSITIQSYCNLSLK